MCAFLSSHPIMHMHMPTPAPLAPHLLTPDRNASFDHGASRHSCLSLLCAIRLLQDQAFHVRLQTLDMLYIPVFGMKVAGAALSGSGSCLTTFRSVQTDGDSNDKPTAMRSRSMARSQCWTIVSKRTGSLSAPDV